MANKFDAGISCERKRRPMYYTLNHTQCLIEGWKEQTGKKVYGLKKFTKMCIV